MIQNTYDFQNELSSASEASAEVKDLFQFSASSSYKEIEQVSQSRKQVFNYAIVNVQDHVASLDLNDSLEVRPLLGAGFFRAAATLPSERTTPEHKQAYDGFIQRFGTHFSTTISLGGMAYSRVSTVATRILQSKEREQSFQTEAMADIKNFSAGAGVTEA